MDLPSSVCSPHLVVTPLYINAFLYILLVWHLIKFLYNMLVWSINTSIWVDLLTIFVLKYSKTSQSLLPLNNKLPEHFCWSLSISICNPCKTLSCSFCIKCIVFSALFNLSFMSWSLQAAYYSNMTLSAAWIYGHKNTWKHTLHSAHWDTGI